MGCTSSKPAVDLAEARGADQVTAAEAGKAEQLASFPKKNGQKQAKVDTVGPGATTAVPSAASTPPKATGETNGCSTSEQGNGAGNGKVQPAVPNGGKPNGSVSAFAQPAGSPETPARVVSPGHARQSPGRVPRYPAELPLELTRAASAPLPADLYVGAPMPPNEKERNQMVCNLGIPDQPSSRFDDITTLLKQIFKVKIAIVSIVEGDRQWFKSVQGLAEKGTDRRFSFCAWTLLPQHPEILVIPDALEDIRFAENPLVTHAPHIRFYAGAPLVSSSGLRLGSLCIIDSQPRQLEPESCNVLINFAEIVVRELEREHMRAAEAARIATQRTGLLRAFDAFKEGLMVCSSDSPDLQILFFNDAWSRMTGMERSALGASVWDLFEISEKKEAMLTLARHAVEGRKPFAVDFVRRLSDGRMVRFTASFRPASSSALDNYTPEVAIPVTMASVQDDGVNDDLYFCTMTETVPSSLSSSDSLDRLRFRDESTPTRQHPFDDVKLGPLLGQGSFGKVFRGMWNGSQVAVKIIQPPPQRSTSSAGSAGAGTSDRAELECLLTAQLSHPNIVSTLKSAQVPVQAEVGAKVHAHETWLVLEYCDQGTLQYAIERGKFDAGFILTGRHSQQPYVPAIKKTAQEVAEAMCYLHGKDILHGDLTGGNILLRGEEGDERGYIAKVADFGLARSLDAEAVMTQTYGTVTHMPPELLTAGHLSKATDSYAWGIILWELFTGTRPWAGMLPMQVIYHVTILSKRLTFPDSVPAPFKELGEACLDPDPARRPTFAQIVQRLKAL